MKVILTDQEKREISWRGTELRSKLMRKTEDVANAWVKRRNKSGDIVMDYNAIGMIARLLGDWLDYELKKVSE